MIMVMIRNIFEQQINIFVWFLKDVTLKTDVIMLKISFALQ